MARLTYPTPDLSAAIFEPTNLPTTERAYTTRNLWLVTYASDPRPLTLLRTGFTATAIGSRNGRLPMRFSTPIASQEWEHMLALERCRPSLAAARLRHVVSNCVEASLNKLVFDLTFQYGMNPDRPLYIVGALWLLCSIVYVVIIKTGKKVRHLSGLSANTIGRDDGSTPSQNRSAASSCHNCPPTAPAIVWRESAVLRGWRYSSACRAR